MRPKPLMPPATAMVGAWAAAWGRVAAGRALPDVVNAEAPEARRAAAVYFLRWVFGLVRAPFFVGRGVLGLGQGQGYSPSAAGRVWLIHGVSCTTHCWRGHGGCTGATGGGALHRGAVGRVTCVIARLPVLLGRSAAARGAVFCRQASPAVIAQPSAGDLKLQTRCRAFWYVFWD